jgi:hypothetical protein
MQENGKWRRHNSAIYKIYDTNVVRNARMNRLKLAGYVARMNEEPIPNRYSLSSQKEKMAWKTKDKMAGWCRQQKNNR